MTIPLALLPASGRGSSHARPNQRICMHHDRTRMPRAVGSQGGRVGVRGSLDIVDLSVSDLAPTFTGNARSCRPSRKSQ
jgi:hypothetical protein